MTTTLPTHHPFVRGYISDCIRRASRPDIVRMSYAGVPQLHRWAKLEAMRETTEPRSVRLVERFVDHVMGLDESDPPSGGNPFADFLRSTPKSSKRGLLLTGPPGPGKTTLAVAAMREWCIRTGGQRTCRFLEFSALIEAIKAGFGDDAESVDLTGIAEGNDFVVLDDLGQVRSTEWVQSQYYSLINALYVAQPIVVITSNIPLERFEAMISPAVMSRVAGMCEFVELAGKDRRLETARA